MSNPSKEYVIDDSELKHSLQLHHIVHTHSESVVPVCIMNWALIT